MRYVDDSHARFSNLNQAEQFQTILNRQHPSLKYTIKVENKNKIFNFLDITVINNTQGKYEFNVYRKNTITNIQINPHSNHDPKILKAIFKGSIHKAYSICSENYLKDKINFLIQVFTKNGYDEKMLKDISNQVQKNRFANKNEFPSNSNNLPTISLPWIPIIPPRLKRIFRKAGYRTVFKSNANLKTLLTSENKSKLPCNSTPGTYLIKCKCSKLYVGKTKLQIRTRVQQHQKFLTEGKLNQSALALHKVNCNEDIEWNKVITLKVEDKKIKKKVREALEIQKHQCSPTYGGMNLDNGQYLKTKFPHLQ
ncbi:uncharacterized protein LOC136072351 [Hydra vulgaris]|uniref:uncharacterized protein LOC136072351 n=1 Tax=Hydra vulgaris TaxID=6087 RepID=UPI0032EA56E3